MKSLAVDPSNYSAHRLLSDSYATKPRHEIARASEYLQSQLLQPLNYNPIQPSLAYTDLNIIRGIGPNNMAFNEYNRMFERNGIRFTTTGIGGSNSTLGDEAALSGIYNKFSYSLGQLHYQTDGFRKNNDLKHNIYNAFAQYEISPALNVQAEYRHRETEHGDLGLYGGDDLVIKGYRRTLNQDTYRYGMRFSPSKNSDWLLSFVHANRTEQQIPNPNLTQNTKSYDIDIQNLFHNDYMNTITGLGLYRTDNHNDAPKHFNTTQYFAYVYSNFKLKNLTLTTGLSFDHYRDNNDYQRGNDQVKIDFNSLNPKFGLIWQLNKSLSLRAALFKSVKSTIVDNQLLQPTQIAGFNQFFDEWNGTSAWLFGVGMDTQFNNFSSGIEVYRRELNIPYYEKKSAEELYRFYLNWIPLPKLAINTGFKFENYRGYYYDSPVVAETTSVPLEFRFFSTMGFFATLKGTYINQFFNLPQSPVDNFKSNFYLVDAAVGYRFPKQYGLLSLEAKNLFDTHFKYVDRTFQGNEQRPPDFIPERLLFARITLNF
jgi:hypothetical protein